MEYRVFPPIGVGRLGNSAEFFYGPEVVGSLGREATDGGESEVASFKDSTFRIKRQAIRFHLYQRATPNDPFVPAVLALGSRIKWTVHVANRKDAIVRPSGPPQVIPPTGLRPTNDPNRSARAIDPGPQSIEGPAAPKVSLQGTHAGVGVELGAIQTDGTGRLIFVPAAGVSNASPLSPIGGSFYNNPNWHDDVCDGTVSASVIDAAGNVTPATGAWLVTAPPDFARGIDTIVTLHDIIEQVAVDRGWIPSPVATSFTKHIYPLIRRADSLRWSHGREAAGVGTPNANWGAISQDFVRLADRSPANAAFRTAQAQLVNNVEDLSILSNYEVTAIQRGHLSRWASGVFESDWVGIPPIAADPTPESLTQANLQGTAGQGFFPGIEAGLIIKDPSIYVIPFDFRLDPTKLLPGDLTALMALPWQADFLKCRGNWWPAQRPDIAPQADGSFKSWGRIAGSTSITHQQLVDHAMQLGVITPAAATGRYVEQGRDPAIGP